jgi:hypothetical protein
VSLRRRIAGFEFRPPATLALEPDHVEASYLLGVGLFHSDMQGKLFRLSGGQSSFVRKSATRYRLISYPAMNNLAVVLRRQDSVDKAIAHSRLPGNLQQAHP